MLNNYLLSVNNKSLSSASILSPTTTNYNVSRMAETARKRTQHGFASALKLVQEFFCVNNVNKYYSERERKTVKTAPIRLIELAPRCNPRLVYLLRLSPSPSSHFLFLRLAHAFAALSPEMSECYNALKYFP